MLSEISFAEQQWWHDWGDMTEQSLGFLEGGEMLADNVREGIKFCKQKHNISPCPIYPASAHHRSVLICNQD